MGKKLRKIPYGIMNWSEVVHDCHFVDNTGYIRALENCKTPVFLRPKRFGKTVICSMLGHYYDIALKDRFDELFGMTEIGREPTELRNSFLMLRFDFSTIQAGTLAEIERLFAAHVRLKVGEFAVRYRAYADWSQALSAESAAGMIDALRSAVKNAALPPLYVIIDEYDNFANELALSRRDAEYDALCGHDARGDVTRESFFKTFFKSFKAGLEDGTVGRTYFTGVLPITLDDLSSGFNVGTPVQLDSSVLGMAGFTQRQVETYVDEIFAEHDLAPSWKTTVLGDLKRFYDGYHFLPGAEPLYNATTCNWYLRNLVADRKIPMLVVDANARTDVGWFRLLARTNENAVARVRAYVERGEGEAASVKGLSAKFGRAKFFSEDFFPYALYYLGLLTFATPYRLSVPNLTIRDMLVDYYDDILGFKNGSQAAAAFIRAAEALTFGGGTWQQLFEQYWQHYVKARIPAQAFDQMNENFFRTTFTSRCFDVMPMFFSFETEYNTPEGRCDFLAVPKPNVAKHAMLIEFKYFTSETADRLGLVGRVTPDEETRRQALGYARAVTAKPDWGNVPLDVVVVEICSGRGYNWIPLAADVAA